MKGKVLFVVGLGVGYVLGTRAGRRRYDQIKSAAGSVWNSSIVQKQVHTVQDFAADRIGDLGTAVTEGIKRTVTGSNGSAARAATARPAATPSAKARSATSAKARSATSSKAGGAKAAPNDEPTQDGGQGS